MTPTSFVQPALPYKDRRGWLIAFGIVEILFACLNFLIVLLVIAVFTLPVFRQMRESKPGPTQPLSVVLTSVVVYGGAGALFLIFGVGSVRCRNWARIGMIVMSGIWLVIGVISALVLGLLMPEVLREQAPLGSLPASAAFTLLFTVMIFFCVVVPAVLFFFYTRPSVRATCDNLILRKEE